MASGKGHSARRPSENPIETPRLPSHLDRANPNKFALSSAIVPRWRPPGCRLAHTARTVPNASAPPIDRSYVALDDRRACPALCSAAMIARTPARFAALLLALVGSAA